MSAVAGEKKISVTQMAVHGVPRSGPANELLDLFKLSAKHIAATVESMVVCNK